MSLWMLAIRSLQQRPLASLLTMVSLALGVGLVSMVLSVYGAIGRSFKQNASQGYLMVVGAKGSPLQLTLNSVFYIHRPIETIPYSYYLEFYDGAERQRRLKAYGGMLAESERDGIYSLYFKSGWAIPICLGDYLEEFRVVATVPAFFEQLQHGPSANEPFTFSAGRNFQEFSEQHGYFEAVVGAQVAKSLNLKIGDSINPNHGSAEGHKHDQGFTIVGILDVTGAPNDRAVYVNLEGFYLMDGHAKPIEAPADGAGQATATQTSSPSTPPSEELATNPTTKSSSAGPAQYRPLGIEQRELTAVLLKPSKPMFSIKLANRINEGLQAQAVAPNLEIEQLMQIFVRPIQWVLLLITTVTCIVAAVSVMVSIYNSMNDRRRDIAVMRALGADRSTVMMTILLESMLIAIVGGVIGWLIARVSLALVTGMTELQTGVRIGLLSLSREEFLTVPLILLLAALAGLIPGVMAYRTEVSKNL
jgi:putative ABC transport system permease protein